jgi:hypothetical protein
MAQFISDYTPKPVNFKRDDDMRYEIKPVSLLHPLYPLVSKPSKNLLAWIQYMVDKKVLLRHLNHERSDAKYPLRCSDAQQSIMDFLYGTKEQLNMLKKPEVSDYQDQDNWPIFDQFARKLLIDAPSIQLTGIA